MKVNKQFNHPKYARWSKTPGKSCSADNPIIFHIITFNLIIPTIFFEVSGGDKIGNINVQNKRKAQGSWLTLFFTLQGRYKPLPSSWNKQTEFKMKPISTFWDSVSNIPQSIYTFKGHTCPSIWRLSSSSAENNSWTQL